MGEGKLLASPSAVWSLPTRLLFVPWRATWRAYGALWGLPCKVLAVAENWILGPEETDASPHQLAADAASNQDWSPSQHNIAYCAPSNHERERDADDNFAFAYDNPAYGDYMLAVACEGVSYDDDAASPSASASTSDTSDGTDLRVAGSALYVRVRATSRTCSSESRHAPLHICLGCPSCTLACHQHTVHEIRVNSVILSAKSPFFLHLFSCDIGQGSAKSIRLQMPCHEQQAMMDLLCYFYTDKLPRNDPGALQRLLRVADKYNATACARACVRALSNMSLSLQNSVSLLSLRPSLCQLEGLDALAENATKILLKHFGDFDFVARNKKGPLWQEYLTLPAGVLELLLSSPELCVQSEDTVFDAVVAWIEHNFPATTPSMHDEHKHEDKQFVFLQLARQIRFPHMSIEHLADVVGKCPLMDNDEGKQLRLQALEFRALPQYRQQLLCSSSHHRRYTRRPVTPQL
eukprot:jgi/Chlat1/8651/Chrsp87S08034